MSNEEVRTTPPLDAEVVTKLETIPELGGCPRTIIRLHPRRGTEPTAVPEPSTRLLAMLGMFSWVGREWREWGHPFFSNGSRVTTQRRIGMDWILDFR